VASSTTAVARTGATGDDRHGAAFAGALAFALLAVGLLAWAKWVPYLHKLHVADATGAYPGHDLLTKAGRAGSPPSLARAWEFSKAYAAAIWPALLAALVIAAAVEALLPGRWLLRALGAEGLRGRIGAGLSSLPSMMCTCCSAPVVWSMRRTGVSTGTALAYWLGNPLLNPAVLALLAIVLPWQWAVTRVLIGGLLVFAVTGALARLAPGGHSRVALEEVPDPAPPPAEQRVARRLLAALVRLGAVLLPEYALIVLLVGLFRGWLLPLGADATHVAALATVIAAVAGTLVVVPTGGEIPLITGLAAAGMGKGPLGALLICLPAVSLPSMAMVGRAVGWRVTAATAVAVAAAGVLGGALLWALSV
jgi:uncharacterized protein